MRLSGVFRIIVGTFVATFASGGCAPEPPAPIRFEQRAWTDVSPDGIACRTEHFELWVTARDPVLRSMLPAFMETAYAEYVRLIPPEVELREPLPVYLFHTRDQWAAFTRQFAPLHAPTYLHIHAGGYTDQATGASVAHDIGRDRTLSLLAHEGMHQYLARQFTRRVPSWLNEGLACQFEAFDMQSGRPVFTPRRNLLRRGSLREALAPGRTLIDLAELLRMDAGHAIRQPGAARVYYAQLWSLVLFLREGPYQGGFHALLADAGTARLERSIAEARAGAQEPAMTSDGELALLQYVTADLDALLREYRAYLSALLR